jgi:diamine N-acetyltransferase
METEDRNDTEPKYVSLREITGQNIRAILTLRVSKDQERVYPRSNGYSIAEGHYPADDDPVWIRAIYAGEEPVGFLMTSEAPNIGEYGIWRIMVDEKHQGRGYGSRAVGLLIERIKASPNAKTLFTSHVKGDGDAGPFYLKLGFEYTRDAVDGNETLMEMDLQRGEDSADLQTG